jgi:hypothetical protein
MVAGANNYVMFEPTGDDGTGYTGRNEIHILGIGFMDADGNWLTVNANAGENFPLAYDHVQEGPELLEFTLGTPERYAEGGWITFNDEDGTLLGMWKRAVALVVEYDYITADGDESVIWTAYQDGGEPGKFVIQVPDHPTHSGWAEILLSHALVDHVPGKITLYLFDFDQVSGVWSVGWGAWSGAEDITRMYLIYAEAGAVEYTLGDPERYAEGGWVNFNSGDIPIEVFQGATALVIEYEFLDEDGEEGTIWTDYQAGGEPGKFVVQVSDHPFFSGWHEILLNHALVEHVPGKITLYLDDMDQITGVSNIGWGAWNGADTITRMYLITTYGG